MSEIPSESGSGLGLGSSSAVPADTLPQVQRLYDAARYLQAWRASAPLGPLEAWPGLEAQLLAGRLAMQLGAPRRGMLIHLRAHRTFPGSTRGWIWALRVLAARLGPYAALSTIRREGPARPETAEALALRAVLAASLRDFQEADRCLARAQTLDPSGPWIQVERASVLERADDCAGALEATGRALELRPWYRPAIDARAHVLVLLGREEEAMALLQEALGRFESASTARALLSLQMEQERWEEAEATLDRIAELLPLRKADLEAWLHGRRSDAAFFRGDATRAAAQARLAHHPFFDRLAERLESSPSTRRRVLLPVAFVRQNHLTCAPATLAALSRFFGAAAAHLEIAESICYDGTPAHAQWKWATSQGFVAREFTVTWEALCALLDRQLPFALSTVDPGSAHMQAVVGYDDVRRTVFIRDPGQRALVELAESGLERWRTDGPRGLVIVPRQRVELLDGLPLPESDLYDLYREVQAALVAHERDRAAQHCRELEARAPGHRLALQAARSLAGYDRDEEALLAATEALLRLFPNDVNLRLSRQASLAELARRESRIAWLRAEIARQGHPLLVRTLAETLRADARDLPEAVRLVRRVLLQLPYQADGYHLLGHIQWDQGDRQEALCAYRAAACLENTSERYTDSYFRAARLAGRTEEALSFLRSRFEKQGRRSAFPALTLFDALDLEDRSVEAFELLQRALTLRPDDGTLLLFAARAFSRAGRSDRAAELLQRARGSARASDVLRTEARLAEDQGALARAAGLWLEIARIEPLNLEAIRAATWLLDETQGRATALAELRRRVERFPHHLELGQLLIRWLSAEPPATVEAELRRHLAANPADAWALRELATTVSRQGRPSEALELVDRAAQIDPDAPALHNVRALVLADAGRPAEARASLRQSIRLDVDGDWAVGNLLRLSADAEERRDHLRFVHQELIRQVTLGDGLLAYQEHATGLLEPEEILRMLRDCQRARPGLWQTWVALARQLRRSGDHPQAQALLEEAAARFPMLPRIWLELAQAHREVGAVGRQRAALERAFALNPAWPEAALSLAELLHGRGEFQAELTLLQRAVPHSPSHALLHGWLADCLRVLGRAAEAMDELQRAVRLDPGYAWAWETLAQLSSGAGQAERARALVEEMIAQRPHDVRVWMLAGRARPDLHGRLEALRQALEIEPRHLAARELLVETLLDAHRFDEALAMAAAPVWGDVPPRALRLWSARIEARRGRPEPARTAVEALLAAEPDYALAWEQLSDWHLAAGRIAEALATARQAVQLAPNRAVACGYLADALLAAGERAEAKEALRRAMALDTSYDWAIRRLFDAQIEDGELDEAAATLASSEHHLEVSAWRLRQLRLAARRADRTGGLEALAALAATGDRESLEVGTRALDEAGWRDQTDAWLAEQLTHPEASRATGAVWHDRLKDWRPRRRGLRRLRGLLSAGPPPPAALGAAGARLDALAKARDTAGVRSFVRRYAAILSGDTGLWGTAGYALLTARLPCRAASWLSPWRQRSGVEPWMLLNLAAALRDLGRESEAGAVNREALRLPRDQTSPLHEILLAADGALRGDFAALDRLPAPGPDLPTYYRFLLGLAEALRLGLSGDHRRAAWDGAWKQLAAAAREHRVLGRGFLSRYRRRAIWSLARRRAEGGLGAPFWFLVGMRAAGGLRWQ